MKIFFIYYFLGAILNVCGYFSLKEALKFNLEGKESKERSIHVIGDLKPSFMTLISIYFRFKSKHESYQYDTWLSWGFESMTEAPLVVFCDQKTYLKRKDSRTKPNLQTIFIVYDSVWDLMEEFEMVNNKSYSEHYKTKLEKLDPYAGEGMRTATLFALWNLKCFYTDKVTSENPFNLYYM